MFQGSRTSRTKSDSRTASEIAEALLFDPSRLDELVPMPRWRHLRRDSDEAEAKLPQMGSMDGVRAIQLLQKGLISKVHWF